MHTPHKEEETCVVPETISHSCRKCYHPHTNSTEQEHTISNRVHRTASCNQICPEDTNEYRQTNGTSPPANNVTSQVDLLLGIGLRPEADTTQYKWPVDWSAGVG